MYQSGSLKQLRIEILVHILFGQTGDESAGQMFHHVVCLLLRFLGCVSVRKKKKKKILPGAALNERCGAT